MNLRDLLMFACDVQRFQVSGGPGWADSSLFNIEAKPPESSPAAKLNPENPNESLNIEQRRMLLGLLHDRFQLKFHVEYKEGPVYYLERGGGEPKLSPPRDSTAFPWVGGIEGGAIYLPTEIAGTNSTIALLADRLSRALERPVIDKTGIQGSFDFRYKREGFDPNADYTRDDVISSILSSVHEIGLKLTPAKGPVETIVIDQAEKPLPN